MRRGSHIKRQILGPLVSGVINPGDITRVLPFPPSPVSTTKTSPSASTSTTSSSSSSSSSSSVPSTSSLTSTSVSSTTPTVPSITPTPSSTTPALGTTPNSTVHTVTQSVDAAPPATSSAVPSPPKSFLQNKVASGVVFALAGIVGLFIILTIARFAIKRRGKNKLMKEAISFDPDEIHHHGAGDNRRSFEKWGATTGGSEEHAPSSLRGLEWNNHSQIYQHERKFFDPSLGSYPNLPPPRLYHPFDYTQGQTRTPA